MERADVGEFRWEMLCIAERDILEDGELVREMMRCVPIRAPACWRIILDPHGPILGE